MKKIAIIGAGISGLFFANLLKNNSDYEFTIFEKRTTLDIEDGYGIQLSVNSIKLLNQIGFKNINQNEIYNPKKINFINAKNNQKICDLDISKLNYDDNKYTTLKRSALLQFLINNISKNKIRLNAELKNLNYTNVKQYFNSTCYSCGHTYKTNLWNKIGVKQPCPNCNFNIYKEKTNLLKEYPFIKKIYSVLNTINLEYTEINYPYKLKWICDNGHITEETLKKKIENNFVAEVTLRELSEAE